MQAHVSQSAFYNLKRQATQLKRSSGITHSEALDQIAIQHGYANWSLLAKHISPSQSLNKPHHVNLHSIVWPKPDDGLSPVKVVDVPTVHPPKHYEKMKWMPVDWMIRSRSREGVDEKINGTVRALRFMDATNLKPSTAWISIFRQSDPQGFDHTCVWRDEQNHFIITTEPYHAANDKIGKLIAWGARHGWDIQQMPRDIGIWNPCVDECADDCRRHTVMFVMAPPKNGGDVFKIADALRSNF